MVNLSVDYFPAVVQSLVSCEIFYQHKEESGTFIFSADAIFLELKKKKRIMGGCVSTSNRSTCSSRSNGETGVTRKCTVIGCCGQKRTKRTFSDHVITMHNLPSIPNRVFMNGKSRTACIFTQQGRKGINQDAMIVWEVSKQVYFFI